MGNKVFGLLCLMTSNIGFSQDTENLVIGMAPIVLRTSLGFKYERKHVVLESYFQTNGDYFAGLSSRYGLFQHLDVKVGLGLGELNDAHIADYDAPNNPIFPFFYKRPDYVYSISKRYFGGSASISSRWEVYDRFSLDIEWASASRPFVFYGKEGREGPVPVGKKFTAANSIWSLLVSVVYRLSPETP